MASRVEQLRRVKLSLEPFITSDRVDCYLPQTSGLVVQENVVAKRCEMEQELERMKLLLARVGGQLSALCPSISLSDSDFVLSGFQFQNQFDIGSDDV
jgi:hypothetical protein